MIKACIFDLDGTLMYTLPSIAYSANLSFSKHGYDELIEEKFKEYVGGGVMGLVNSIYADCGLPKDGASTEEIVADYIDAFKVYYDKGNYIYDGINDALKAIADMGMRLTVFTNKPEAQAVEIIDRHFPGVFEMVVGATPQLKSKPDPEGALLISEKLGIAPEEIMYIGDTKTDTMTGFNAGMYTVGVAWGYRTVEELMSNHADVIAYEPADLVTLAKER